MNEVELFTINNQKNNENGQIIPTGKISGQDNIIYDDEKDCTERLCLCNRYNIFFNCLIKTFHFICGLFCCYCCLYCCSYNCSDCFACIYTCRLCCRHIKREIDEDFEDEEVMIDAIDLDPRNSFAAVDTFRQRFSYSRYCFSWVYCLRYFCNVPKMACCTSKRKAEENKIKLKMALEKNNIQEVNLYKARILKEGGFINSNFSDFCNYLSKDAKRLVPKIGPTNENKMNPMFYIKKNINTDFEKIPYQTIEINKQDQN